MCLYEFVIMRNEEQLKRGTRLIYSGVFCHGTVNKCALMADAIKTTPVMRCFAFNVNRMISCFTSLLLVGEL